jgi:hypothetical protein
MLLDGWEIDIDALPNPYRHKLQYPWHFVSVSPTGRRAALVYDIHEYKMGWSAGCLALVRDRKHPKVTLTSRNFIVHMGLKTVIWLTADLLAVISYVFDRKTGRIHVPFSLFDLKRKEFSFIPIPNSGHYTVSLRAETLQLRELERDGSCPSFDELKVRLSALPWYSLDKVDSFRRIFL